MTYLISQLEILFVWFSTISGVAGQMPEQPSKNWKVTKTWNLNDDHPTITLESINIGSVCKGRLIFPEIFHAHQAVYQNNRLIAENGPGGFDKARNVFATPEINCEQIANEGGPLIWKVRAFSSFFARVPNFPWDQSKPFISQKYFNYLYIGGAIGLCTLSFVLFTLFIGSISLTTLIASCLAPVLSALYLVCMAPRSLGLNASMLELNKFGDGSIALFMIVLPLALREKNVITRRHMFAHLFTVAVGLFFVVLAKNANQIQIGTNINCATFFVLVFIFVNKSISNLRKHFNIQNAALLLLSLLFAGSVVFELAYFSGLRFGFSTLPIGLLVCAFFLILDLNFNVRSKFKELSELKLSLEARIEKAQLQAVESEKELANVTLTAKLREKDSAIARMTSALAHDVKKPFSMLKLVLNSMGNAASTKSCQEIARASIPEITQAIVSVEGMIHDVMQIGSDSKPHIETASPIEVIACALNEVFRIFYEANITIDYALHHQHTIEIDTIRVGRVFSNILGNALQAMDNNGTIWIKTREVENQVEFTIGNAGSLIAEENLPKLFDAFFTSDKKGGTGLGLAIAQKVVQEHGGSIWCKSQRTEIYPEGFVEFIFTLPKSEQLDFGSEGKLPKHSKIVQAQIAFLHNEPSHIQTIEEPTDQKMPSTPLAKKIKLAFLDDSKTFTMGWKIQLKEHINIEIFNSTQTFLAKVKEEPGYLGGLDLIVTDFHFAPEDSHTGKTLAAELRTLGFTKPIYLASNGNFKADELLPEINGVVSKEAPAVAQIESWLIESKGRQ